MGRLSKLALHLMIFFILGSHSLILAETAVAATTTASQPTSSDGTVATTTSAKKFDNSYVSMDKWFCGAGDYDKTLSHQMAESDCPIRMYEANLCCLAHDLCYMEESKTQQDCDSAFCFCLDRTVTEAARALNSSYAGGCGGVSSSYCMIVQLFGGSAHRSAKALRAGTTPSTTTSAATTAVVTTPTTAKSTTVGSASPTTKTPADIAQFITHNVSLQCFDYGLSSCVEQMHSCMRTQNSESQRLLDEPRLSRLSPRIQLAIRSETESNAISSCAVQFCACASNAFLQEKTENGNERCSAGLAMVCNEMAGNGKSSERLNVHFWTINVMYFSQGSNLILIISLISIFLVLMSLLYVILRAYRGKCRSVNAHLPTIVRPGDLDFSSWQKRQKRDSKAGYSSFKKTSDASTDSGTHCDGEFGNGKIINQHLHAPHHRHHHHMIPMSSSKVQLISPDENSSSSASTPSINSNE